MAYKYIFTITPKEESGLYAVSLETDSHIFPARDTSRPVSVAKDLIADAFKIDGIGGKRGPRTGYKRVKDPLPESFNEAPV